MEIATILPIPHLEMTGSETYNMALAHLIERSNRYADWFKLKSKRGDFILMDNGVVELGYPMDIEDLMIMADRVGASEMVLPDYPLDNRKTVESHVAAIDAVDERLPLMAVPQGRTQAEWRECARIMTTWPQVHSIGISRFVTEFYADRRDALTDVPELIDSDKQIHLLGCPGITNEFPLIDLRFPGRIRGLDSGIAAIYTQEGLFLGGGEPKPEVELEFDRVLDESLLERNVEYWRREVCYGSSLRSVL